MDVVAAAAKREICHRVIYGVISPRFSAFFRLWEKKRKKGSHTWLFGGAENVQVLNLKMKKRLQKELGE